MVAETADADKQEEADVNIEEETSDDEYPTPCPLEDEEADLSRGREIMNRDRMWACGCKDILKTVAGQPFAEPPTLNYQRLVWEDVPSDRKLEAVFGNDTALRTRFRGTYTERQLLPFYSAWCWNEIEESPGQCGYGIPEQSSPLLSTTMSKTRVDFYYNLVQEIKVDEKAVLAEYRSVLNSLSSLQQWENAFLDNNGDDLTRTLRQVAV